MLANYESMTKDEVYAMMLAERDAWKQRAEAAQSTIESIEDNLTERIGEAVAFAVRKAEAERDAAVKREEVADAVAKMAAHDRDEALVNLDAACKAARANAAELMQGTIDGITRERDAARADAMNLRCMLDDVAEWLLEAELTSKKAAGGYDFNAPLAANLRSRSRAYFECREKIRATLAASRAGEG